MSDRPTDPADTPFGVNRRAGYGDRLARVEDFLRKHPDATLASGEGRVLLTEIDHLRADRYSEERWANQYKAERDALQQQLLVALADEAKQEHRAERAEAEVARLRALCTEVADNLALLIGTGLYDAGRQRLQHRLRLAAMGFSAAEVSP